MWGVALRNFVLQRSRYRVLVVALVLGAIVFTLLFGVAASLTKTVREKAARYFSGDIVVLATNARTDFVIADEPSLREALRKSGIAAAAEHRRSVYYGADGLLFFQGESLIQRRVVGVDFSVEHESFSELDFVDGQAPGAEGSPDGIWISDDTARRLHVKVGDSTVLMVTTERGYRNTVNLRVDGIFADSSLFGFACYLDYRVLNKALERSPNAISEFGVTLREGGSEKDAASALQRELEKLTPTAPLSPTKEAVDRWAKGHRELGKVSVVLTLTGRLKQINDLIQAVHVVNTLLTLVFLFVVSIGVYNTYQMIVFERTREIGTLRAMGLSQSGVVLLFLREALLLGGLAGILGLFLGTGALWGLGQADFSGNLLAGMFLVKGHLAWVWPGEAMFLVLAIMIFTAVLGALNPSLKGSQQRPVDALRQD